jgi:hypothetical protein
MYAYLVRLWWWESGVSIVGGGGDAACETEAVNSQHIVMCSEYTKKRAQEKERGR